MTVSGDEPRVYRNSAELRAYMLTEACEDNQLDDHDHEDCGPPVYFWAATFDGLVSPHPAYCPRHVASVALAVSMPNGDGTTASHLIYLRNRFDRPSLETGRIYVFPFTEHVNMPNTLRELYQRCLAGEQGDTLYPIYKRLDTAIPVRLA